MRVLTSPDFRSLLDRLHGEILDARRTAPRARLRILTPGEGARREVRLSLARRLGGFVGLEVLSLPGWIEATTRGPLAAAGGIPFGEAALERLVALLIARHAARPDARDALARLGDVPGVARAAAATFRDLMEGGFGADDLDATDVGPDPLRLAIRGLYADFLRTMERENWWDRRRRESLAAATLADDPPGRPDSPTYLFGFHDLTARQRALVAAMDRSGPTTLLVPGVAGPEGSEPGEAAASPLLQWAASHGADVDVGGRTSTAPIRLVDGFLRSATLEDPGPATLQLVAYPTEAAEVRGIARAIRRAMREEGRPVSDFLITRPPGGPSPRAFRRIFARAGLPLRDRVGIPPGHTEPGRRAILLARAITAPPEDRDREALAFLPGVADTDVERDRQSRAADALLAARTGVALADAFRTLHEVRFGGPPGESVESALAAIELVHAERTLSPRDFATALASALFAEQERDRGSADASVLLVSAAAARFHARPVVFHTGRIEGSIRRPPPSDPLLPDAWRRNLNERHEHAGRFLPVGEDRREEQWLLARFAFEAATERCVVSWALRERTGTEIRNPSGLILDLVARRAGGPLEAYGPAFDDVVPRDEGAEARRFPADATDHDLALFAAGPPPTEDDLSRLLDEPRARHLAPALLAGQARWRGTTLGPHDGVLRDERALHRVEELLRGRSWSATALEALANCPFSYLVRLLKLDNDRPEQDDYDPMERGKLFHTLLERIYSGLVADGRVPLSPELLADAIASLDRLVAEEARGLDRESPRRRLQRGATLRSLRDDAAILLAREAHRPPALRTTPVRVEMAFGFDEDDPSRTPTLPSAGGGIALRGKIDRVDRRPDGALEVVDFKTGKSRAKSHELRATIDGKTEVRLQLPVYLEAARQGLGVDPARAYYSHATTDRGFDEVEITAADRDRILPEVIALVGHLLERARSGWFPCTPGRACCRREFAAACGPGVVARFQRKRHDPALEAHLAIVRGPGPEADA